MIWLTTRLDREQHRATYHRFESGRFVACVDVSSRSVPDQGTETTVAYSYVGLSESGNREIAVMTQEDYDAKLIQWAEWIERYLTGR